MKSRTLILFLLAITVSQVFSAAIDITIQDDDVTVDSTGANSETDGDDVIRIKRSGSPDFFGYIKKGITSKISQLAQASASASATFSKGSSGGRGYTYYDHDSYPTKSFDFWTLKKSILNTLFQAVKAINGGIIAIKGQLIKGGGAIISAKGRLISMKGEAITNLGKNIITSAKLIPHPHSKPAVVEYSAPTVHSAPSGLSHPSPSYGSGSSGSSGPSSSGPTGGALPPSTYGAPTAPAGYGPPIGPSASASAPSQPYLPQKLNGPYEAYKSKTKYNDGVHAGIVIVKKVPKKEFSGSPPPGIEALPLQDERNKVVESSVEIGKPVAPNLFTPEEAKPPQAHFNDHSKPDTRPFFESTIKDIPPPKLSYAKPIEAPHSSAPPSGHSAQFSLPSAPPSGPPNSPPSGPPSLQFSAPSGPEYGHLSPPGYVDESLLHPPQKSVNDYFKNSKKPQVVDIKEIQNYFQNNDNLFFSKVPAPFDINSFGSHTPLSQHGLNGFNNVPSTHSSIPGPFKPEYDGSFGNSYAPAFNLGTSGVKSLPLHSNLQFNTGLLDNKGTIPLPEFDVVKSVSYELPAHKRAQNRASTDKKVEKKANRRNYQPIIKRIEIIH